VCWAAATPYCAVEILRDQSLVFTVPCRDTYVGPGTN
jgi:hypothetical protein